MNMNTLAVVAIFSCLAVANAGIFGHSGTILQGPSAKATIVGADGSIITSLAPGGQIIAEENPGVVAHTAPVVAAYSHAVAAAHHTVPVVAYHGSPIVPAYAAYSGPAVGAYSAPVVAHNGVIGHSYVDTVVAGPSGTIVTSKTAAAPALVAAHGVVAHGVSGHLNHGVHGLYF